MVAKSDGFQQSGLGFYVFDKGFGVCYSAYQDYVMRFEVASCVFVFCKLWFFVADLRKEDFLIWKGVQMLCKVFSLLFCKVRTLGYHYIVGSFAALRIFSQKSQRHYSV